jgi:serine/threonine-protein kinase
VAEQSSADYRGTLGRYALYGEIASGGMATVHFGRLLDAVGFARTVAIKRLHPHLAKDPDFVAMFLDEARLAARVKHPNVIATLDVVREESDLFLVMEYVAGESLSRLIRRTREQGGLIPPRYVVAIMCATLEGLQAAHDATSESDVPLGIVHRDVSPQNIHVGIDGVGRVLDFGIAKATNRFQETRSDQIKGKVQYMSPEQLAKGPIDRRADVYSASVVMWEALTGKRLFKADDVPSLVYSIISDDVYPPSSLVPDLPQGLDEVVMRGLDREADNRWASAREMAVALEKVLTPAAPREIAEWLMTVASEGLAARLELVRQIERETSSSLPPPLPKDEAPKNGSSSGVNGVARVYAEDEDRRETSVRFEVTAGTETRLRESRSKLGLALVALLMLLAGATALAIRLVQLQSQAPLTVAGPVTDDPAASARAETVSVPTVVPVPASASATATATATAKPSAPPNDCDNPFVTDAKGRMRPKPHCFKR